MASELADRLRAGLEEFNRTGVIPRGFYAPDFELHQASSIVDTQGVFRGADAATESLTELTDSFADLTFEPEEILEAPGGELVVLIHTRGRGRASGMVIDNHIAWVWTFRDGLAIRMVVYEDQREALAAVGIER
jgi:ketosteroid isomerase-like protein